jgi:UDP-N-acetylglucosamine 2-epimerase (non-hydrolysing)
LAAVESAVASGQRLLLVTVHRRESWGEPMRDILHAVRDVLDSHPGVVAVLPTHPNPSVRQDVFAVLGGDRRVVITPPLDYPDLVRLLKRSTLVLSDSGGIQEEAPSFGVPVLVLRDHTERVEAVEEGCALLVGTDRNVIATAASRLLSADADQCAAQADGLHWNPFGDGLASQRAAVELARLVGLAVDPVPDFTLSGRCHETSPLSGIETDWPVRSAS